MHGTNSVNHNEAPQNFLKTVTILLVCGIVRNELLIYLQTSSNSNCRIT